MNLQRFVSQAESKSGFINNVEYADPKWMLSLETRGYQDNFNNLDDGLPSLDEVKAFWASLRGGIRSVLIRHPKYICPRGNKDNPDAAKQTGYLEKVENGNILTVTGHDRQLKLSAGDYASFQYGDCRGLGLIVSTWYNANSIGMEVEPKLQSYIKAGATVYFDRIELIMRPDNNSFSISNGYPYKTAKFQFMESRI